LITSDNIPLRSLRKTVRRDVPVPLERVKASTQSSREHDLAYARRNLLRSVVLAVGSTKHQILSGILAFEQVAVASLFGSPSLQHFERIRRNDDLPRLAGFRAFDPQGPLR